MARYNLKNDFEDVYLRSRTLKKYLPLADQKILTNPEFTRVVNYISNLFYQKYRRLYGVGGFDLEDIQNVTRLWGLAFTGYGGQWKSDKDKFTVMMRFVSQRLWQMTGWIAKKFQCDEVTRYQMFCTEDGLIEKLGAAPVIEEAESKPASPARSTSSLKKDFEKDVHKHSNALSYYSVSKAVSGDVRKRARFYCKKYGIDYQGWAKNYLDTHDCDESNFQIY